MSFIIGNNLFIALLRLDEDETSPLACTNEAWEIPTLRKANSLLWEKRFPRVGKAVPSCGKFWSVFLTFYGKSYT